MNRLDELMVELFPDEAPLPPETPFRDYKTWDSLKHVHLVVGIESRFALDLSADEIAGLASRRAVEELLRAKGAS